MKKETFPYEQEFFDYLEIERGLADRTVGGYRIDLGLFAELMTREYGAEGMDVEALAVKHVRRFLAYLKNERNNDAKTRNRKLLSLLASLK